LSEENGRRGEVIVDRRRLETLVFDGDVARPTIVMLHEGLGSVSLWRDFPARIAKATRCGVLVYSRYGHGASDRLAGARRVNFMHHEAEVVLPELLGKLNIERPILLGHSDGGSIALIYAAMTGPGPRSLILEAPHVFVEELTVRSIAKIRDLYASSDLRSKLGRHHAHVDEVFRGWNGIWLKPEFRKWNIEDRLAKVRCPVLVIQGVDDEYGTMEQVAAIRRGVTQAPVETLLLPECGHSPHRDRPKETVEAIEGFLADLHGG